MPILGAGIDEVIASGDVRIEPDATDLAPHGVVRFPRGARPSARARHRRPEGGLARAPMATCDPTDPRRGSTGRRSSGAARRRSSTTAGSSPSRPSPACAWRSRGCSTRATPRCCAGCARGWPTACAIDHPDGLMDPGGYLERLSAGDRRRVRARREDPRARRGAARLVGDGRHDRLRRARRDRPRADRPGRRSGAGRAGRAPARRRDAGLRGAHPRDEADDRRHDPAAPRSRGWCASCPPAGRSHAADALAELLACFPVYRSYLPGGARAPRRGGGRGIRSAPRPRRRDRARWCRCSPTPPHRGRAPVPADDRTGDGQGRGGHRLLSVHAARLAHRGRRGSFGLRAVGRGLPPRAGALRQAAWPRCDDHAVDARHEARRGRPRAPGRAGGGAGALGCGARRPARVAPPRGTGPSTACCTRR